MTDQGMEKMMLIEKTGTESGRMLRASQGITLPGSSKKLENSQVHISSLETGFNMPDIFSKYAMRSTCIWLLPDFLLLDPKQDGRLAGKDMKKIWKLQSLKICINFM